MKHFFVAIFCLWYNSNMGNKRLLIVLTVIMITTLSGFFEGAEAAIKTLPDGTKDVSYPNQQLEPARASFTLLPWSLSRNTLTDNCGAGAEATISPGLTLGSGGMVSGTPTKEGKFGFTTLVNNEPGDSFCVTIKPPAGTTPAKVLIKSSSPLSPGDKREAEGGKTPYAWRLLSRPEWMSIITDNNIGIVVGMPSVLGTFNFTAEVTDADYVTDTKSFSITITSLEPLGTGPGGTITGPGVTSGFRKGKLNLDWPPSPLGTSFKENPTLLVFIKYLYEWLISLGGLAAFVVLVYAGFMYLTSAGNPQKMSDAMARIKSASFGLILLLSSVLILNTINPQLTALKLPNLVSSVNISAPNLDLDLSKKIKRCDGVQANSQGAVVKTVWDASPIASLLVHGSCQVSLYGDTSCGDKALVGRESIIIFNEDKETSRQILYLSERTVEGKAVYCVKAGEIPDIKF